MKINKKHRYIVGLMCIIAASFWFFVPILNANQLLLNDLTESVSGSIKSVSICKVFSNEVPQDCTNMNEESINNFIRYIHQAKKSLPLNHPKTINMYLIKIVSIDKVENHERNNCFLVSEIEGQKDLYFSKINAGENCSNNSFQYLEGSVSTSNFLKTL